MDATIIGHDNRFKDSPPVATDTDPGEDFSPLNINDLRKYTQWKATSVGQKYITSGSLVDMAADALVIRGHNLGDASAEIVVESSPGLNFTDPFNNGVLNTVRWATSLSGGGSIVETTELVITTPLTADAALVYGKQPLGTRTLPWQTKLKGSRSSGSTVSAPPFLALYQDSVVPAVADDTVMLPKIIAEITQETGGDIRFSYLDDASVRWYFDGSEWQNIKSIAYAGATSTVYVSRLISDGENLIFELWNFDESSLLVSASISFPSLKTEADDSYIMFGNPYANRFAGSLTVTLYEHVSELGGTYTNRLAAFTPDGNGIIARLFTSVQDKYWRVGILTASVVPFMGILIVGQRIEMPYSPDGPINLYDEGIKAITQDDDSSELLGTTIKSRNRRLQFSVSTIERAFVFGTLKNFWDNHSRDRKPFVIMPYPSDFSDAVWWMRNSPSYRWTTPLRFFEWVESATFDLVGPIEDDPPAGDV